MGERNALAKSHDTENRDRHSPTRCELSTRRNATPRIVRIVLIVAVSLYVARSLTHLLLHARDHAAKHWPTDFSSLTGPAVSTHLPAHPVRTDNGTHVGERYAYMRQLGRGCEGKTAIYVDLYTARSVVVKRYNTRDGNEMPIRVRSAFTGYTDRWPNEIEANWLLAPALDQENSVLIAMEDFFILQPTDGKWVWAMVTPFIEGGTLSHAAARIKKSSQTPDELDKIYRSHLYNLLEVLSDLHNLGYCHDDVKSDNVLVSANDTWLLGDLGNVRHLSHPLHDTGSWARRNHWVDCQLNDVRRLLKTYIAFLREASIDGDAFDVEFLAQEAPWSRLYAEWMRYPVYAKDTLALSQRIGFEAPIEIKTPVTGPLSCLRRKIDQELTCTRLVTRWRDYWLLRQC